MTEKQVNDLMARHGLDKTRWHGYAYRAIMERGGRDYDRMGIDDVVEYISHSFSSHATYPNISDALSTLTIAGLLIREKEGRKVYYSLPNDTNRT